MCQFVSLKVVDIMKTNVEKVLERDQKLSELDDRADALQQGASQFEQQAGKLKRKFWLQNLKVNHYLRWCLSHWSIGPLSRSNLLLFIVNLYYIINQSINRLLRTYFSDDDYYGRYWIGYIGNNRL